MPTPKFKLGDPKPPNSGRKPGVQNKTTRSLREALLNAAEKAGDGSLTEYLYRQALENPGFFMSLLGRLIPLQLDGELKHSVAITRIEHVIIDPKEQKPDAIEDKRLDS